MCSSWLLVVFFIHSVPGALFLQALDSISSSWIPMEEALSNCDAVVQPLGLLRCLSQSCQAPTKLCPYMLIRWVKGTCVLDLNSCLSQNQHRAHRRQGRAPAHLVLSYLCLSGLHKWASWTLPVLLKKGHSKNRRERERADFCQELRAFPCYLQEDINSREIHPKLRDLWPAGTKQLPLINVSPAGGRH